MNRLRVSRTLVKRSALFISCCYFDKKCKKLSKADEDARISKTKELGLKIIVIVLLSALCLNLSANTKTIDELSKDSKKLLLYSTSFFNELEGYLKTKKPLHGKQLTILHQLTAYFLTIDSQLKRLQTESKKDIYILSEFQRIENLYKGFDQAYKTPHLRRLINDEDLSFKIKRNEIHKTLLKIFSAKSIENLKNVTSQFIATTNNQSPYFTQIIKHPIWKMLNSAARINELSSKYRAYYKSDLEHDKQVDLTNRISRDFGNTAGRVRWRKGHLLREEKIHQEISSQLQPLDIITEKTYFALTDKLIPGHFGHNAIWLGTKDQLQNIGMWNHPSILPYQKEIMNGKSILEIDRSGSHLKSLKDFMNVDEFAILRVKIVKNFSPFEIERTYKVALSQIGKIYDFNFDVETTDKLVCSELMYQAYQDIHWPTRKTLGRFSISPDDVTSLALYDNPPLKMVYYVAAKKRKQIKYKNLDNLANDMKFTKRDGKYKKILKKCPQNSQNNCQEVLMDLVYSEHDYIQDFSL